MDRRPFALGPTGTVAPVTATTTTAVGATGRPTGRSGPIPPPNRASALTTLPAATTQVVVVTGSGYGTTYATLETFHKAGGHWVAVSAPLPARIGSKGFSDDHVEGVATTPTGVYSFGPTMYGIGANPGLRYPYHQVVTYDWWNENPNSSAYNSFQHSTTNPGGFSEALWQETPAYTHFAVITYNMPPNVATPVPNAGSGIFLHEFSTAAGNPTAGCVSLSHGDLLSVLTWLDPARSPRIVLCPAQNLSRY
jgi:L,D-peptidoglycan transpeptidase YkuD (ErfK/YbiS/YcfS/YnhG family)